MKNLCTIVLISFCGLFSSKSWSIGLDEVVLQEISSTERSIAINRGLLESYNDGSFAKFFVQTGTLDMPKIFLVAEGKLIKSFPKKSFWYMSKVYIPRLIKPGDHILVLTSNAVKVGNCYS